MRIKKVVGFFVFMLRIILNEIFCENSKCNASSEIDFEIASSHVKEKLMKMLRNIR